MKADQFRFKQSRLKRARARRTGLIGTFLAAAVLLVLVTWLAFRAPPQQQLDTQTLDRAGESEMDTQEFQLGGQPYLLSAELLAGCQYTFYLTPTGALWGKAGQAIASASGETTLAQMVGPFAAGRYFVHVFTAPEEGCSWALHLKPS